MEFCQSEKVGTLTVFFVNDDNPIVDIGEICIIKYLEFWSKEFKAIKILFWL